MMIQSPVAFQADPKGADASEIISQWHFMATGADGIVVALAKGVDKEEAVEKLREVLCLTPAKFKKIKYTLSLVHPETYIQGLTAWHPPKCHPIHIGEFTGG
jgi:hypothetical protein